MKAGVEHVAGMVVPRHCTMIIIASGEERPWQKITDRKFYKATSCFSGRCFSHGFANSMIFLLWWKFFTLLEHGSPQISKTCSTLTLCFTG